MLYFFESSSLIADIAFHVVRSLDIEGSAVAKCIRGTADRTRSRKLIRADQNGRLLGLAVDALEKHLA